MLSPPSSAHFFTSDYIVFYAARFLSQQGASFFLQLHHRSLSCSHRQVLHNSSPLTASFSPLLDFCLNKVLLSFFSSIVIPFMLSPPSSAQFFNPHCIVLYAARFLSQQGASFFLSFFLQLHHHHPFHALTPKFCTILVLILTLSLKLASLKSNSTVSVQSSVIPWCKTFVLYPFVCSEVVASLRFVFLFFWVWFGWKIFLFIYLFIYFCILVFVVACNKKKWEKKIKFWLLQL